MRATPIALALAVLAGGCALNPPKISALEQARAEYATVQSDPHVRQFASRELAQAGQALNNAEALAKQHADDGAVKHQAYLAQQQARVAREIGLARAADAQVNAASGERQRIVLEAKAQQAEARARVAEEAARQAKLEQQKVQNAHRSDQYQADIDRLQREVKDLRTQRTPSGWAITMGTDLLFDSGSSSLKPGGRIGLAKVAALLKRQPGTVEVDGFTDARGSEPMNQTLSEHRAQAVKQVLVEMGVDQTRITTRGRGEAFPVASNDTPAGRQLNRRVEILVSPPGGSSTGSSKAQ